MDSTSPSREIVINRLEKNKTIIEMADIDANLNHAGEVHLTAIDPHALHPNRLLPQEDGNVTCHLVQGWSVGPAHSPSSGTLRPLSALLTRTYLGEVQQCWLQYIARTTPNRTFLYASERWIAPSHAQQAEADDDWVSEYELFDNAKTFLKRFQSLTGVSWNNAIDPNATCQTTRPSPLFSFQIAPSTPASLELVTSDSFASQLKHTICMRSDEEIDHLYYGYHTFIANTDNFNDLIKRCKSPPLPTATTDSKGFRMMPNGFNLPFESDVYQNPHASRLPVFLKEIMLNKLCMRLREKSEFERKIQDPLIRHRWVCEATSQAPELSPKSLAYMLQEVEHWGAQKRTALALHRPFIQSSEVDGVWLSDDVVTSTLRSALLDAIRPLEDVPEEKKDYHPNSKNQVVNLVHPSMYCLIIGISPQTAEPFPMSEMFTCDAPIPPTARILPPPPVPARLQHKGLGGLGRGPEMSCKSARYQWLPAEFEVDDNGAVRITSYVNNLHPLHHASLYPLLEQSFSACLPLLERVLTQLVSRPPHRLVGEYYEGDQPHADRMDERLALRAWNMGEMEARQQAKEKEQIGASASSASASNNTTESENRIDYLRYRAPLKMSDSQKSCTRKVLGQISLDMTADPLVYSQIAMLQDSFACMLLQEAFGVASNRPSDVTEDEDEKKEEEDEDDDDDDDEDNSSPFVVRFHKSLESSAPEMLAHAQNEALRAKFTLKLACLNSKDVDQPLHVRASLILEADLAHRWFDAFRQCLTLQSTKAPNESDRNAAASALDRLPDQLADVHVVGLLGAVEFFTGEMLELACHRAEANEGRRLITVYLSRAIEQDEELYAICSAIQRGAAEALLLSTEMAESASLSLDHATTTTEASRSNPLPLTRGGRVWSQKDSDDKEKEGRYHRKVQQPDVSFPFPNPPPFDQRPTADRISLRGRTLQVIVKIASIELTADNSEYPGGAWHVEGMLNEAIVASAIVYLKSENITDSYLAFRQSCEYISPEQDDNVSGSVSYGLERDGPMNQLLGSVHTRTGRTIAFPNIFQHQVQPFRLEDKTRPGKRTILVFFLVDPTKRVVSTSTVPPQQRDWVEEHRKMMHSNLMHHTPLIDPIVDMVQDYSNASIDFSTLDRATAESIRLDLMAERSTFVKQNSQIVFQRPYSFCEH